MFRGNAARYLQDKCVKKIKHFYSHHTIKGLFSPLFQLNVGLHIPAMW